VTPKGGDVVVGIEELLKEENAAWNSHDVDKIATFYTDDCIKEDVAVGVNAHGKEAMNAVNAGAFAAVPDMKIDLRLIISSGDAAATEWTMSGTYSGNRPGVPPATGRPFSVRGATIMQLRDGRISRVSDYWDSALFLQQVGSMPFIPGL
jgi:steroid delta-isomerase-like uncharacterized protein